ncbi:MAG: hypothetical protein QOE77_3329 [Blastocatellia bacterium]|nr:hypothetical protein [Blastocatellia bacterium]
MNNASGLWVETFQTLLGRSAAGPASRARVIQLAASSADVTAQLVAAPLRYYDAYAFSQVHAQILTGEVAIILVNVGATPRGDKEVDYHNAILADSPSYMFFGTFYGGLADQDGSFTWKSNVEFNVHRYDGAAKKVRKPRPVSVAPRTVPLEVGYTKGSRTMLHLGEEHGLARWPYGSESITVFVTINFTRI